MQAGSAYHLQWRELPPGLAPADVTEEAHPWNDGLKLVGPGKLVGKGKLKPPMRCQVRAKARIGPCLCAFGDENYRSCSENGACKWTPWSQPSAPCTPLAAA